MELNEFKRKYEMAKDYITDSEFNNSISEYIDNCPNIDFVGGSRNTIINIEEAAELIQALTKMIRGKGDRLNLIEEIADVYISLKATTKNFGITDEEILKAINVKFDRIHGIIEEDKDFI